MQKKDSSDLHRLARVEQAIGRIRSGGLILVRDDEGRENEGDLVCAAELATPESVAFMAVYARGLICQTITRETAERLNLPPQAARNEESNSTAFTVSVDAADGITTGISAYDRYVAARILANPESRPEELVRPGHLFPIVAKAGGVFQRKGHTEASVDLARLAGLQPSGLICEVLKDDGTMARGPELEALAREWNMPLITVEEIIAYRDAIGDVELTESTPAILPTPFGEFTMRVFRGSDPSSRELALLEHDGRTGGSTRALSPRQSGAQPQRERAPIVRLHSECLTGEALHSERCDCGAQLDEAMRRVAEEGGALVYLRQEGRGIGLFEKVKAYTLQDRGMDTLEANLALGHDGDQRRFGSAAAALKRAGYTRVRLLTNNPEKVAALERAGIEVAERLPLHVGHNETNRFYLTTKFERMGHLAPQRRA